MNRHTYERLHKTLHQDKPKKYALLQNCNTLCRLDELKGFDGTFSEFSALNSQAWLGLKRPSILWTYDLVEENMDTYFQQHLLMNVYPMAPMPKNDHSIQPGSKEVYDMYALYSPLFSVMHGARWFLDKANPVEVLENHAITNVFSTSFPKNSYVVAIMLSNVTSVEIRLNFLENQTENVQLQAAWPGYEKPYNLGVANQTNTIPLKRGCAMLIVNV